MSVVQRYDSLINCIENSVAEKPYKNAREILDSSAKQIGFYGSERELNAIFQFFTGEGLIPYIKSRKLDYAYSLLMQQESFDLMELLDISGFDNQNSFGKAFKKAFGLPPMKTFQNKEELPRQMPFYWNNLSDHNHSVKNKKYKTEDHTMKMDMDSVFGIKTDAFEKIVKLQNLCALYGCDLIQGEAAFNLAEKHNLDLDRAFEYTSNFHYLSQEDITDEDLDFLFGGDEENIPKTVDEFNAKSYFFNRIDDPELIYCYFNLGLDMDSSVRASGRIYKHDETIDITSLSPQLVYACAYSDSAYIHIEKAVKYYMDHISTSTFDYERFDYFLEEIDSNVPIEYAFENASEYLTDSDINDLIHEINTNPYYLESMDKYSNEDLLDEMAFERGEYDY